MALQLRHPGKVAGQAAHYRRRAAALRAVNNLDEAERLEAHAARLTAQLTAAERCRHCGRPLEDPVSVSRGIGSTCWSRGHR